MISLFITVSSHTVQLLSTGQFNKVAQSMNEVSQCQRWGLFYYWKKSINSCYSKVLWLKVCYEYLIMSASSKSHNHTHPSTLRHTCGEMGSCGLWLSTVLTLTVWGHKYSFSIYQPLGINPSSMDKMQNTTLHNRHVKPIIYCKVPGIAHRRLMAFYQGSLEGCSPPPPTATASINARQVQFKSTFSKMHLL